MQRVKDNTNVVARTVRNLALLEDPGPMAEEKKRLDGVIAETSQLMSVLQQRVRSPEGLKLMDQISQARPQFLATVDKAAQLGLANDMVNARNVVVIKRGKGTGFAGIENALFYADNTRIAASPASDSTDQLWAGLRCIALMALAIAG